MTSEKTGEWEDMGCSVPPGVDPGSVSGCTVSVVRGIYELAPGVSERRKSDPGEKKQETGGTRGGGHGGNRPVKGVRARGKPILNPPPSVLSAAIYSGWL